MIGAIISCKKRDFQKVIPQQDTNQKFFAATSSLSPILQKVVGELKRQEGINPSFISNLVKADGYALWNKCVTKSKSKATVRTTGDGEDTVVLVPLVQTDSSSVDAYIEAHINGNVQLWLWNEKSYKDYGYGVFTGDAKNAETFVMQFLKFNYSIFGIRQYKIIDPKLFKDESTLFNKDSNSHTFLTVNIIAKTLATGEPDAEGGCIEYEESDYHLDDPGHPWLTGNTMWVGNCDVGGTGVGWWGWGFGGGGSMGGDAGGTGSGGSGGGTGGSGGGSGTPCTGSGVIINGQMPCDNGGGGIGWQALHGGLFANLDSPVDAPDDVVIENGIEIEQPPLNIPQTTNLIGYSPARGNTEDLTHGTNGNATGIRPFLIDQTDNALFSHMTSLFHACTFFDNDLRTVGDLMIQKFKDRTGGQFSNSILNDKVSESSKTINYLKAFGDKLRQQLTNNGGNIQAVTVNMGVIRPAFTGLFNKFHGLQILINDTEETDIYLDDYSSTSSHHFEAVVTIVIHDHFGLDKNDALEYQFWHDGFPSWWLLQHIKDYVPFETIVKFQYKISGDF